MAVFVVDSQDDVDVDVPRLRQLADHVVADRGVPAFMEVSVLCVDVDAMIELNRTHMGADGPTDVLAFPIDRPGAATPGETAILGDVVLCPTVAADQAAEHGTAPQAEMDLLVVHGLLHLLGHDHAEEDEKATMFALTDVLLRSFGTDVTPQGGVGL